MLAYILSKNMPLYTLISDLETFFLGYEKKTIREGLKNVWGNCFWCCSDADIAFLGYVNFHYNLWRVLDAWRQEDLMKAKCVTHKLDFLILEILVGR